MNLFGYEISFAKKKVPASANSVPEGSGNWWPLVNEPFTGAWQRNVVASFSSVTSNNIVFSCMTLIASDIAKMGVQLKKLNTDTGIWALTTNAAYDPVLRQPNQYQNWMQFIETWMLSKLLRGNTYVLKVRDNRNVVIGLYVLDPQYVKPLVSDDGQIFYQLSADNLSGIEEDITVPASEIIHDRWNCLFHNLIGVSPLYACYIAATQGLAIQKNSSAFFNNKSQPGGFLSAPGAISPETAQRLKDTWATGYTGENAGKIAVAGDGLKYESIAISAADSQLIEQLKYTSETICSVFHVPPYKVGVGAMPQSANIQSLNVEYYSQALQVHVESIENVFDNGLNFSADIGIFLDVDNLLRMDSLTMIEMLGEGVAKTIFTPNEARKRMNLPPQEGGDALYLQQQNYSLAALAKRDASDDPFKTATTTKPAATPAEDAAAQDEANKALREIVKGLAA